MRYACLTHDLGKGTTPDSILPRHLGHEHRSVQLLQGVSQRLRAPAECHRLAEVVAREHGNIHRSTELQPAALLRLLERCDALRRPERFQQILLACECDARGRLGRQNQPYPQGPYLSEALRAVQTVNTATLALAARGQGLQGDAIGQRITRARQQALEKWQTQNPPPLHPLPAPPHMGEAS